MSDTEVSTLLHQVLTKIDRLSDKMSDMETSMNGTLQKHSTEIAQLQKEKETLFTLWNKEFQQAVSDIRDNRHNITNLDGAFHTAIKEMNETMNGFQGRLQTTIDDLAENTKQDFAKELVAKERLDAHNRNQNIAIVLLTLASVIIAWIK